MPHEPQQPSNSAWKEDPFDDAGITRLMRLTHRVPQARPEFLSALARELDDQFQARRAPSTSGPSTPSEVLPMELELATSPNGRPSSAGPLSENGECIQPSSRTQIVRDRPKRRARRLLLGLSAAAALIVAVGIWSSRPAYGWAAMIRALEDCQWVQAATSPGDEGSAEGWLSARRGVVAVRWNGGIVFDNRREGVAFALLPGEERLVEAERPADATWDWGTELARLLIGTDRSANHNVPSVGAVLSDVQLVRDSWRHVTMSDGRRVVELRVTLRTTSGGATAGELLELVLLLDPETHLPLQCRLAGAEDDQSPAVELSYATEGPASIVALGVSESLPVVAVAELPLAPPALLVAANRQAAQLSGAEVLADGRSATRTDAIASEFRGERIPSDVPAGPASTTSGSETKSIAGHQGAEPDWSPLEAPLQVHELTEQVNELLASKWAENGIQPVGPATDAEFARRAYLDLTGRVPTVAEAREFLASISPNRREELVDRLLAHHDHATHLATIWRDMLLPEGIDRVDYGSIASFEDWLAARFQAGAAYDQVVRDLLTAEGRVAEAGPMFFYAALRLNAEELAGRTSRAFLGVRMDCAQCHDHPFDDISQTDFWGFAAFFARISRPRGAMNVTSAVLQVRDSERGEVMIPESDQVVPPRLPQSERAIDDTPEGPSRRGQLVDWLTAPYNRQFAYAAVNRVWAQLFGRGLVDPVDDMRPANEPICPEVLDLVSRDFAASGFDLQKLYRALVLTDAYQLSSRGPDDPARTLHFAQMNTKSLAAEQLYDCIAVATQRASTMAEVDAGLVRATDANRQAFINQFRTPPGNATDYLAGIPQALTMMHGSLIDEATAIERSGLLRSLSAPFFSDSDRLDALFLATLSRYPRDKERELLLAEIEAADAGQDRRRVLGDILWALLNSAEFTFNH